MHSPLCASFVSMKDHPKSNKNGRPSFFFKRWWDWPLISTRLQRLSLWQTQSRTAQGVAVGNIVPRYSCCSVIRLIGWIGRVGEEISLPCFRVLLHLRVSRSASLPDLTADEVGDNMGTKARHLNTKSTEEDRCSEVELNALACSPSRSKLHAVRLGFLQGHSSEFKSCVLICYQEGQICVFFHK